MYDMFNFRPSYSSVGDFLSRDERKKREEEEEARAQRQWASTFSPEEDSGRSQSIADRIWEQRRAAEAASTVPTPAEEAKASRNWFDRVLAPLEAPQQFLFALTEEVADDGFQFSDLTKAISHGAKYFNPWSEQERISPSEIADIFTGGNTPEGFAGGFLELGISLLYDPLLISGAARAVGVGGRAVRNIERVANPASLIAEGAAAGGRRVAQAGARVLEEAVGAERYTAMSQRMNAWLRSPSQYLSPAEREARDLFRARTTEYQIRAGGIIKDLERAGGPVASELLTEVYTNLELNKLGRQFVKGEEIVPSSLWTEMQKKIDSQGIAPEFFWEAFDKWSTVADDITRDLLKLGLLDPEHAAQFAGTHIRNSYSLRQSPTDLLRRNAQVREAARLDPTKRHLFEGGKVFQEEELRKQVAEWARHIQNPAGGGLVSPAQAVAFQRMESTVRGIRQVTVPGVGGNIVTMDTGRIRGARRGWRDRVRVERTATDVNTVDVDEIMGVLQDYISSAGHEHSLLDAMEFLSLNLFEGQAAGDLISTLGNYLAEGMVRTITFDDIDSMAYAARGLGLLNVRPLAANPEVLAARKAIPVEIAEEVLGRTKSAAPRILEDIKRGGGEAVLGQFFDDVSGAVRMNDTAFARASEIMSQGMARFRGAYPDFGEGVKEVTAATSRQVFNEPAMRREMVKAAGVLMEAHPELALDEALKLVRGIPEGTTTASTVIKTGSPIARHAREGIFTQKLEGEAWGSLNGMYVSPMMEHTLKTQKELLDRATTVTVEGAGRKFLDAIASGVGAFKFFKIPADIGATVRDAAGSIISGDITGAMSFNPAHVKQAANMVSGVRRGEVSDLLKLAHDAGYDLFGASLSYAELGAASRRVGRTGENIKNLDWIDSLTEMFESTVDFASNLRDKASNVYLTQEMFLRSYSFVNRYETGIDAVRRAGGEITRDVQLRVARQAGMMVDKALYNYADVPIAIESMRKYGVAPFITYPMKTAGQLVDTLYNRPWNILKYHRTMEGWNTHWAGGDEAFAREIQALPEYMRENLVVRLPWENTDGNPLYLDLSYFLPWSAVRDLTRDVAGIGTMLKGVDATPDGTDPVGLRTPGAYPGGAAGGGIFSPVVLQLRDIFNGKDGLGREIFSDTDSTAEKQGAIARELWRFMAPPTFVGGSTADSVGKAIVAATRTSPEPRNWVEWLGLSMRTGRYDEDILNRYGEGPLSRALPTLTDNPVGQVGLGVASLLAPVTISDASRQDRNEGLAVQAYQNEIAGRIRSIAANPNLSQAEKERRVARLTGSLRTKSDDYMRWRSFINP